jgi:hypothetical protein
MVRTAGATAPREESRAEPGNFHHAPAGALFPAVVGVNKAIL